MDNKIDPCDTMRMNLIAAAVGLQQCTKTDGTEVHIPGTGKRILIGDDAYLAKVAAPATAFPNDGREPDWGAYAAAEAKHLPGWERGIATVTMTGHQLREALDFINPGGDDEPDERDDELTFGVVQVKDHTGHVSTGLCCWNDDSDGVLPLDAQPDAPVAPPARCAAGRDGECGHEQCPQLRDGEPAKSGRHCPLDSEGGHHD